MPRNSTGTYSLTAGNPVITGTVVASNWANTTMPDLGNEMTDSLSRSGKGSMLAALKNINGVVANPSVSFTNDIRTGLYLNAVGDLRAASSQVDRMRWNDNGTQVWDAVDGVWYPVISSKDLEANAVLLTTNQTVDGVKTFTLSVKSSAAPVDDDDLTRKDYVDGEITTVDDKINTLDAQNVKLTGDQTVADVKTFTAIVKSGEQPVDADDLTRKDYVDTAIATVDGQNVKLTGDQTVDGVKTFTQPVKSVLGPAVPADLTTKAYVDGLAGFGGIGAIKSASRNTVLNQDPVSQDTASRAGVSSTIYTGNGTTQSISTGIDMATGDFGGLVWTKRRDGVASNWFGDSVRGLSNYLTSNATNSEAIIGDAIQALSSTGYSVAGNPEFNANAATYVAWSWQTTEKTTGTTNRNKAFTSHYNSDLGFSITGYEGDGADGHEIPHFLGKEPELVITKQRDAVGLWAVQSPLLPETGYLQLNATAAITTNTQFRTLFNDTTISLGTNVALNANAGSMIAYAFTSIPNVCEINTYIGTGAAGNYVKCGFKVGWVLCKDLTGVAGWFIMDASRNDTYLNPNSSAVEVSQDILDFVDDGFVFKGAGVNTLNNQYIFMAYAEGTAFDGTKTLTNYDYAPAPEVLTINEGTLMSFAGGFNANGELNSQELVGAGVTYTLGAGFENKTLYVHKDRGGPYGSTEFKPLEGTSRAQADKFGVVSPLDAATRTTDKHFGYASATGVALASSTQSTNEAWGAFDKDSNDIVSAVGSAWIANATTGTLQYKFVEPRVLKSWRLRGSSTLARDPRRFTIEGSDDGFTWAAIDSTYTAADYTGNGASLWGDIQDTSANTTAYVYHRINITANNGDVSFVAIAELEFNTITPSDYYNVVDGLVYNNAGTVIDRVYLAKVNTGASGEILNFENLPVAKIKGVDAEFQGDVTVHKVIKNRGICTAWVNFDGTTNPPTIRDKENVYDVVDLGVGYFRVFFKEPMDSEAYSVGVTVDGAPSSSFLRGGGYITGTKLSFDVSTSQVSATVNNTLTDYTNNCIQVFGGKDIL